MRSRRFHGLKKIKVRQDWSRWTLYNLSRLREATSTATRGTYFQQKWKAKSITRAYHGEQVREKQWERMFRRNIPAVVPMDHKYLAQKDGSEQAEGRGSGADQERAQKARPATPYMQMTYYPLERRLDMAVWRSLFASSARQARQFVVHGYVKVNGKRMIYPGYQLNPGDMFQVEPERVLFATGASKVGSNRRRREIRKWKAANATGPKPTKVSKAAKAGPVSLQGEYTQADVTKAPDTSPEALRKRLQALMAKTKQVLEAKEGLPTKLKRNLRQFRKEVKRAISLHKSATDLSTETLEGQLELIKKEYEPVAETTGEDLSLVQSVFEFAEERTMRSSAWNEEDGRKPYATPWRPRPYMSAFAFIPRYLEVNQNICAAVYLRHPVARPGFSEVPSPFSVDTNQLAFNWYLKRR
ncbi:alpha-L RNA-binding motif-containing protein [Mytilinidion resinicola]|uniref:Alpha-L RNA-binding motif-containing protein n=1 Tax=Mytilinidion resinicola TaxID=574789 RepID=A0A6A6Z774_9PEZI|nr:alpha-L RNA-binding motif-containing protein [Mytilinidion resinicola]KAF2816906.1 alpha-L RNA-binding motif-containing protein [Mytilinidion resinicola]